MEAYTASRRAAVTVVVDDEPSMSPRSTSAVDVVGDVRRRRSERRRTRAGEPASPSAVTVPSAGQAIAGRVVGQASRSSVVGSGGGRRRPSGRRGRVGRAVGVGSRGRRGVGVTAGPKFGGVDREVEAERGRALRPCRRRPRAPGRRRRSRAGRPRSAGRAAGRGRRGRTAGAAVPSTRIDAMIIGSRPIAADVPATASSSRSRRPPSCV